jgi:hypothetical protein
VSCVWIEWMWLSIFFCFWGSPSIAQDAAGQKACAAPAAHAKPLL